MKYERLTEKRETPLVMSMWGGSSRDLKIYNRLAEFEDEMDNGTLIKLPCKVGSTVYVISKKALKGHWEEHRYIVDKWGKLAVYEKEFNLVLFSVSKVGKDYFLTKAEAEQKLKELKGEV